MLSSQAKQKMQSTGAELNEKYFYQKDIFLTAHIILLANFETRGNIPYNF